MQQTNQYKLNLIESGDTFSAIPLNENAEKVEAALVEQAETNESAVAALQQAIEDAKASGLQIFTGSYTGNGKYGSSNPNTLTFPFKPLVIFISHSGSATRSGVWLQGCGYGVSDYDNGSQVTLSWSGNSVSWSHYNTSVTQLNDSGKLYYYIALGLN